jgi:heat-inducible transcriptional repressor
MLTSRQEKILQLIVDEYVKSVNPVGSKLICDELNCSSATVRNEMSILEDFGYLEKTHVSSGRIPSEAGYRYYVDNLMEPKKMNGDDVLKLQVIFNNNKLDMPDVIKKSLAIISELTDCTSVVLGSKSNENKLQKVEVLPLMDSKLIAIIVTDKGHVEHKNMSISGVSIEEVQKTVELINKLLIGTPIDEINKKLEFEVKPIINQYVMQHEVIYNAFYNVFSDMVSKNDMSFVGKTNILNQPEFNNVEKIKNLLNKFEDSSLFESIEEDDNDINIYIGKESKLDDDVTVIKTKYKTDTDEGTIAVIGPKRMEYDRVVSLLGYIKEHLK